MQITGEEINYINAKIQDLNDYDLFAYFSCAHLPERLQVISRPFYEIASNIMQTIPISAERSACLRKLLEAKDCAVRAAL